MLAHAKRVFVSTRGAILVSATFGMWWIAIVDWLIAGLDALFFAALGTVVAILFLVGEAVVDWYRNPTFSVNSPEDQPD